MINAEIQVIVGSTISGPDYQPEAHNLLLANGFRALFSEPTNCARQAIAPGASILPEFRLWFSFVN